eukprot:TRINITY_DN5448_c0_g1_i1.p1 TRINITY_DN5448_c0_g1~~TRINITY_DN5448_c0_g1_i1.p1  ORF type:complete len:344 (-),score=32.01 TRINITY_DN5448_c0_g1_i1:22-1053(-)
MRRYFLNILSISIFLFTLLGLYSIKKEQEKELLAEVIKLKNKFEQSEIDHLNVNLLQEDQFNQLSDHYNKVLQEFIEIKTENLVLEKTKQSLEKSKFRLEEDNQVMKKNLTDFIAKEAKRKEKQIVVSTYNEDVSWLNIYVPDIPSLVYTRDVEFAKNNLRNIGNEAYAYLNFIVNNYYSLPSSIAFVHGHPTSWHFTEHMGIVLQKFKWGKYPYTPLTIPQKIFRMPEPDRNIEEWEIVNQYWPEVFEDFLGPPPARLESYCCGQFAVTKERILKHPLATYVYWKTFLEKTRMDSYYSGRLFEYTWHIIFGHTPVWVPDFKVCNYTYDCETFANKHPEEGEE